MTMQMHHHPLIALQRTLHRRTIAPRHPLPARHLLRQPVVIRRRDRHPKRNQRLQYRRIPQLQRPDHLAQPASVLTIVSTTKRLAHQLRRQNKAAAIARIQERPRRVDSLRSYPRQLRDPLNPGLDQPPPRRQPIPPRRRRAHPTTGDHNHFAIANTPAKILSQPGGHQRDCTPSLPTVHGLRRKGLRPSWNGCSWTRPGLAGYSAARPEPVAPAPSAGRLAGSPRLPTPLLIEPARPVDHNLTPTNTPPNHKTVPFSGYFT